MVSAETTIMTSLPTTHINWPEPHELVSAGCDAARLIVKGEMRHILTRSHQDFIQWRDSAHDAGLKLLIDLPGSRPVVTDKEHGNSFHEGSEVIFIDGTASFETSPTNLAKIRVSNLSRIISQLNEGDRLSIADGACMFQIYQVTHYLKAKCEWSSPIELFARGVTFPGVDVVYTCPTEEELELLTRIDMSHFASIILSFCSTPEQISRVRNASSQLSVMAKIETGRGVKDATEVVESADSVLVGRSDLRSSVGPARVSTESESVIRTAKNGHKKVFVGSGLLESLSYQTEPSIADVTDLWYLWGLGVDGILLAGSVSVSFPVRAIKACKELLDAFAVAST